MLVCDGWWEMGADGDVAMPATSIAGWRIVAVGRSEPSPVPALSGICLGPGYIAVGEV